MYSDGIQDASLQEAYQLLLHDQGAVLAVTFDSPRTTSPASGASTRNRIRHAGSDSLRRA